MKLHSCGSRFGLQVFFVFSVDMKFGAERA